MTSFLQTWTEGADVNRQPGDLTHTASDLFRERGVGRGDTVYVAEVADGKLELIGRMRVAEVLSYAEARRRLPYPPWEAKDHLIAEPGTATPKVFGRPVRRRIAERLRFLQKTGRTRADGTTVFRETALLFRGAGLDAQTTRTVRRLTDDSAVLLEALL
jgi:hypothetical protein